MNLFSNDSIWFMQPGRYAALYAMFQQMIQSGALANMDITAGPSDDAEMSGLPIKRMGSLAIITLAGFMMKRPNMIMRRYFGAASTVEAMLAIQSAVADDNIENILFVMDTPGGSVGGVAELGGAVAKAASEKNIIVQVDDLMASAGYWAGCQANKIYCSKMGMTGSIGVRMMLYDYSKWYEDIGIKAIPIDTGEFKSAGAEGTEITERHIADFQRIVDGYFAEFRSVVQAGRSLDDKQFETVGDGRVFLGEEASSLGLIDAIQPLEVTLAQLQQTGKPSSNRMSTASAKNKLKLLET